jgi:hypothetical protein
MQSATEINRSARQAGLLYLAMAVLSMIGYFKLHPLFFISGDPAATARSILAREQLYRVSMLIDLGAQILFILVAVALYRLFRDVDRNQARTMFALVGIGIAAGFACFALNAAPLVLLSGSDHLSALSRPQLDALSYAALALSGKHGALLTSIWGLWLFPFAVLTIKSGFLPKFLGVLLILTGVAYVISCSVGIASPQHVATVTKFVFPLYFGEFFVVLWLALIGAKPRTVEA